VITCKAPYRISLSGGSTDYESFYSQYGSLLVGFGLNSHCYVTVKPTHTFDKVNFQAFYSHAEKVERIDQIQNPGIRGTLQYLKENVIPELNKIAIYIQNDLPSQTGIGSSSSLIVALLQAVYETYNVAYTKRSLAKDAIYIERVLLSESGGIQDQIWAAYGGLSSIEIQKDGEFYVRPIPVYEEQIREFEKWSLLFCINNSRQSYKIATSHNNAAATAYKQNILDISNRTLKAFKKGHWEDVGTLLGEAWENKKQISGLISNSEIDNYYDIALNNGAFGGKLLGTGGGGFLYIMCEPTNRNRIIKAVGLPHLDVNIDTLGSRVIFRE
jgi:D-glycero-alpha-D-manno-heptose-7-phosphate kinase